MDSVDQTKEVVVAKIDEKEMGWVAVRDLRRFYQNYSNKKKHAWNALIINANR